MKIKTLSIVIVALLIFWGIRSCEFPFSYWNCIKGKGDVITEEIKLSSFSKIKLKGEGDIYLKQGKKQKVAVDAQANLHEIIEMDVVGNTLEIEFEKCYKSSENITFHVTIPEVEAIKLYGSGDLFGKNTIESESLLLEVKGSGDIKLDVDTEDLETSIMGSGDIFLKGDCGSHDLSVKGSGDLNAYDLRAENCEINIKGSGDAKVHVTQTLDVSIMGSGDVKYEGNPPEVSSDIKGSGSVEKK